MTVIEWLQSIGLWPARISEHAEVVDSVLAGFSFVLFMFTVPVFVLMAWFGIKYRKGSPADRRGRPSGSPWIETAWSIIPLLVMGYFFVQASSAFFTLKAHTPDALKIDAVAKQWMWKFRHPNGVRQINQLNVPVDIPVEITMTSQDVIHSLFFPALRIKQDVLPNRYTRLRFTADRTGTHHLTCTEYCGTLHSKMGGTLVVMTKDGYEQWLAERPVAEPPETIGRRLYRTLDCGGCHDPARAAAPALAGLYGTEVALDDGRTVRADERYLHDSIVLPNRHVVAGYRPIMPTYKRQLDETEIRDLIAFIRSLGTSGEDGP